MKQINPEILAQLGDTGKLFTICRDALNILADIITTTDQHRPLNSTVVYVGHFVHNGIRITGRILGPLRTDGGLVLITRQDEHDGTKHQIFRLDDILQEPRDSLEHGEFLSKLRVLMEKAFGMRDHIASEATNYFAGGKVVKSI